MYTQREGYTSNLLLISFIKTLSSGYLIIIRSASGTPKPGKICVSTNCHYCPHLDKNGACWSFTANQKYIVPSRISCKLNNLVYLFTCIRCGLQYVGETSRSLATRMSEHLCDIRHEANPDQAPPFCQTKRSQHSGQTFWKSPSRSERSQSQNP